MNLTTPCQRNLIRCLFLLLLAFSTAMTVKAQGADSYDKGRAEMMLEQIKSDIRNNYYDPTYHGVNLDGVFKTAEVKLKAAQSNGQIFGIIAQAVMELGDSHTTFLPPERQATTDYGWEMEVIGDAVYVTKVKEHSDAEAKGLKVGDRVDVVDRYQPVRENLHTLIYLYYALRPQPGMHVTVASPGAAPREFDILAKVTNNKRIDLTNNTDQRALERDRENAEHERKRSHRTQELGDTFIWKMPEFNLSADEVDAMMDKASKYKSLILDLRGNPGGDEVTLLRLIGNLFDRDVKVGDIQRRKETKALMAKTRGAHAYKGQLIVLVDSVSASSAEILAHVVQLEKRGSVIGDRTSGAVMRAKLYVHAVGVTNAAFYAVSVTDADLKMVDGKSLEGTGVVPDEIKLPEGADLAARNDPVLAYAAKLLGQALDPHKAGELFPEIKNKR